MWSHSCTHVSDRTFERVFVEQAAAGTGKPIKVGYIEFALLVNFVSAHRLACTKQGCRRW